MIIDSCDDVYADNANVEWAFAYLCKNESIGSCFGRACRQCVHAAGGSEGGRRESSLLTFAALFVSKKREKKKSHFNRHKQLSFYPKAIRQILKKHLQIASVFQPPITYDSCRRKIYSVRGKSAQAKEAAQSCG